MSLLGFVLLTLIIEHPILLWISWPLIASGGLASHMTNMPMARSIPLLSSAFQALTAGFISAGAGVPIIWGQMHRKLNYQIIFIIWLVLGSTITILKIVFFSPKKLENIITETGVIGALFVMTRIKKSLIMLSYDIFGSEILAKWKTHFLYFKILNP